jgi:A/G-specific adenine glycosylase
VASLAAADESQVLAAWEGLGYASRARNLHRAAQQLTSQGLSNLPSNYGDLRALPGIGDYTAAALVSFAFGQPALTLDANLKRVFQRLDAEPVWSPALENTWRQRWEALVDGPASRESNQAVMQLGQLVCTARKPRCDECPLSSLCAAKATGRQSEIPEVTKRSVTLKTTDVLVVMTPAQGNAPSRYWLARPLKGRFSTLWLFPPQVEDGRPSGVGTAVPLTPRVHTYTRYRDTLSPRLVSSDAAKSGPLPPNWEGRWMTATEAASVGMVSVYRRILDEAQSLT